MQYLTPQDFEKLFKDIENQKHLHTDFELYKFRLQVYAGQTLLANNYLQEAKQYLTQALTFKNKDVDKKNYYLALILLAQIYYREGDFNNALLFSEQALSIAKKAFSEQEQDLAIAYNDYAIIAEAAGNTSQAIEALQKALKIYKDTNADKYRILSTTINLANLYYIIGDIDQAQNLAIQTLNDLEDTDNQNLKAKTYSILAAIELQKQNLTSAYNYAQKAEQIIKNSTTKDQNLLAYIYYLIANILKLQGKDIEAISYLDKMQKLTQNPQTEKQIENLKSQWLNLL